MDVIPGAVASAIVRRRGAIQSGVGRAVGGLAGAAIASQRGKGTSPLKGQFGYVAVMADRVVLLEAKGAFKSRPTEVVLGEVSRAGASADFQDRKVSGVLELHFGDGSTWAFDIPRAGLDGANQIAIALGPAPAVRDADRDTLR